VAPAVSSGRSGPALPTRVVSSGFAAAGLALLATPAWATRSATAGGPLPPTWLVRLLGGRTLAQHGLVLVRPSRGVVLGGAAVDALHALSMVGAAAVWPQYRRPALVSAGMAGASAALALATAPRENCR
jgi:hypothetical protein